MRVTSVGRWWRLHERGGTCLWTARLVMSRIRPHGALVQQIVWGLCIGFFFGEKSLSTHWTPMRCHPWVAPFLPGRRLGYPSSTSLSVRGEALGPSSPGSNVVSFLFEGAPWYLIIQTWEHGGTSREGAMVVSYLSFSSSALVSIFWRVFVVAPTFSFVLRL
jgi:hypothetical protein